MALFCCAAWAVQAQPEENDRYGFNWSCWIVPVGVVSIRCIKDKAVSTDLLQDNNDAEETLALLHVGFNAGAKGRELETQFQFYKDSLVTGDYWVIPIFTLPYEESWENGWLKRLVRATLCPRDAICHVRIQRN